MFVRFSHTDEEGVKIYNLLEDSGEAATRLVTESGAKTLWPHGSGFSANYEHPAGIQVTEDQVKYWGWEIA